MDERYLRFPRWLEASGLPEKLNQEVGPHGWLVFKRLVEEDLSQNLFPDWVDFGEIEWPASCGIADQTATETLHRFAEMGLIEIREYGESGDYYQYRIAAPPPLPKPTEEILEKLDEWDLPTRPEMWRYWEESKGETKYERVVRLYEKTCGLKMSSRIVEDLVELAEQYSPAVLEKGFAKAREEGVTALGWIRKALKRFQKDERVQKGWGRPEGLELPEGYTIPGGEGSDREGR